MITYTRIYRNSTTGVSSLASSAFTPDPTKFYVVFGAAQLGSATPNVPTLSTTTGLSFGSQQGSQVTTESGNHGRITVFGANAGTLTSGTVTVSFGGQSQTQILLHIWELAGASGVLPQVGGGATGSATSLSPTMGAFASPNNGTLAALLVIGTGLSIVAGTGFTNGLEGGEFDGGTTLGYNSEFMSSNVTATPFFTWTGSKAAATLGLEIQATLAPTVQQLRDAIHIFNKHAINRASRY